MPELRYYAAENTLLTLYVRSMSSERTSVEVRDCGSNFIALAIVG